VFRCFTSLSNFHYPKFLKLDLSKRNTPVTWPISVLVQAHSRRGYEGLVRAAEGRGPPVTLLLVADALVLVRELRELVLGTGLVAEPCDTVPVAAPEGSGMGRPEMWGNEVGGGRVGD
jgi:hypothetical protein